MRAIIFTNRETDQQDLGSMVGQLIRANIDYTYSKTEHINGSLLSMVLIDGDLYEGARQLFNYLEHREK